MRNNATAVWRVSGELFEGLTFKVAETEERAAALDLCRQVYQEDLGHVPIDGRDDVAHHLIALDSRGDVVAGFRVVGPENRPFDFERSVDLGAILGPARSPALIGRLTIRRDHRSVRKAAFLQVGMLKLAHAFAERRGITDFFLYTYPNLIKFYRGSFFDLLDVTFEHPDWGSVHLMRMNVTELPRRCASSRSSLAKLLLDGEMPNFVV